MCSPPHLTPHKCCQVKSTWREYQKCCPVCVWRPHETIHSSLQIQQQYRWLNLASVVVGDGETPIKKGIFTRDAPKLNLLSESKMRKLRPKPKHRKKLSIISTIAFRAITVYSTQGTKIKALQLHTLILMFQRIIIIIMVIIIKISLVSCSNWARRQKICSIQTHLCEVNVTGSSTKRLSVSDMN